ncbi:UPF0758 domain-containing protein [Subtercola frigoramans]|uniref:DNA repair protein RadC n=1 Tax=Subtercola frigoramans TaxID=120298 RepID=A0ABS2L1N9_9MICO|nr:UPF0758 domain-containing protein [Subtercola frigoramans]MBM7470973.1 DNA repair protein RadC [Subtercola frigoramans]
MKNSRVSLWAVAPEDRPREKLARLGPAGLSDAELVALVLGSGLRGVNVLDSARLLLEQSGGVQELMGLTVRELRQLIGVGAATAGRLVAVAELWRRAHDPPPGPAVETATDLVRAIRAQVEVDSVSRSGFGDHVDEAPPATYLVITDAELRLRWVLALATSDDETIAAFASRVLHEVLFRGGSAFAVAWLSSEGFSDDSEARAAHDVLRIASATVGLTFLSALVVTGPSWQAL